MYIQSPLHVKLKYRRTLNSYFPLKPASFSLDKGEKGWIVVFDEVAG